MSAQSHSRLLDLAKEAVRAVASDQSICPETTKESLREIADECEMRIDAINADIEREVH